MHRAEKFIEDLADHILKHMEKDIRDLHPTEVDFIAGLCDLHNECCEFVEYQEKFSQKDSVGGMMAARRRR